MMQASQAPKSRSPQGNPDIVAAVEQRAGGFAAAALTRSGGSVRIIATALLESVQAVASFVTQHQAGRLVRLAPLADTIVKYADIPVSDAAQMIAAAGLMAEAELPSSLAPHRRAGGLLMGGVRPGTREALLTGWLDRGQPIEAIAAGLESFCTPGAALALLKGQSAAAACVDATAHAYCVLVGGSERSAARVVLEDEMSAQALAVAAKDAAIAAAASLGETAACTGTQVLVDASARAAFCAKVSGARDDQAWFDQFGLCVAAAMLALIPETALLTQLLPVAAIIEEPAPVRLARWVSKGARPWVIGIAATLGLVLLPWMIVVARDEFLSGRVRVIEDMRKNNADLEKQAAMYSQLDISRWPLTKLLSDVSGATPVGVSASDVRLSPEQGLTFQGRAKSADLVNVFQKNLGDTRLFRSIKVNRTESMAEGGVEFNLTAEITASQAHVPVKPTLDFAAESLSKRLYGVEAAALPAEGSKESGNGGGSGRKERRGEGRGGEARGGDAEPRRPSTPSDAMPPVVTDDDIKKMDRATANRAWVARKVYVQKNPTLDAATKQRLQDEEAKIRTHAATAPGGAS
ncbi:MAG: PilN domain-containing protein [Planctomycetota bacterium]|nr:PilN domain-containing protein [Planctomycetota bacterium]